MTIETRATYPDLVVLKDGQPVIVVEVKGREIRSDFRTAVIRQLEQYAQATNAKWAILADPNQVQVYRTGAFGRAVASLDTSKLRSNRRNEPFGEHAILLAVERWLRTLPQAKELVRAKPQLKELAESLAGADQYSFEYGLD